MKLAGFVAANGQSKPRSLAGFPVLGTLREIQEIYGRFRFEELVLSSAAITSVTGHEESARLIEIMNFCEANDISLCTLPNVFSVAVSQKEVGTFSGVPVVMLRDASLHRGYAAVKRVMDIVIALTMLIPGLPLWAFIAFWIRLTSKGPILFTQVRSGLHGRRFKMYKFRSMVADAEEQLKDLVDIDKLDVPGFKLKGDPRVTPVGRFLRRASLDEIPQLINVLKGEMSVVGPRPEMPELVERYNPWQRRRLKAKPGITGYQQVMARGQPLAGLIEYDLIYLKHQSLLLDIYILFKTVIVVLRGSGVTH